MSKPEEYKNNDNLSPYWKKVLEAVKEAAKASKAYNPETLTRTRVNSVTINGKTYQGSNVSVRNNTVFIDGQKLDDKDLPKTILQIEVTGDLVNLDTDASVNCDNVKGNLTAGGSVNADNVGGNVQAGGSVNCDDVKGNVRAAGSVIHG